MCWHAFLYVSIKICNQVTLGIPFPISRTEIDHRILFISQSSYKHISKINIILKTKLMKKELFLEIC